MRLSHRNSDCGTGTLTNSLIGAGYSAGYLYTHLGQMRQGPQGTSSTNSQYLCCDSSHPHQLTGLYSLGATCSTKTGQTYTSSYDAWGNVTSRNVNGTTATLSYDGLDNLTMYTAALDQQWHDHDGVCLRPRRAPLQWLGRPPEQWQYLLLQPGWHAGGRVHRHQHQYVPHRCPGQRAGDHQRHRQHCFGTGQPGLQPLWLLALPAGHDGHGQRLHRPI